MFEILDADGKLVKDDFGKLAKELWQYDAGLYCNLQGSLAEQVCHFAKGSTILSVAISDSKAPIPNQLLTTSGEVEVYVYTYGTGQAKTLEKTSYTVNARPEPPEVVTDPTPVITYPELEELVEDMEELKEQLSEWEVTVDANTGTPSAEIEFDEDGAHLSFHNLKGATGAKGDKGDKGDDGVVQDVTVDGTSVLSGSTAVIDLTHTRNINVGTGARSVVENNITNNVASGDYALAENNANTASGDYSHAEGNNTTASGIGAHSEGKQTIANGNYQHVAGTCNVADTTSVRITGWGTDDANRKNIETLDRSGNLRLKGDVYVGCDDDSSGGTKLQQELIAGANITIASDGRTISATGGGGGTSDYTQLSNKPQVNSVELSGNKTASQLGLASTGANTFTGTQTISGDDYTPFLKTEIYVDTEEGIEEGRFYLGMDSVYVNLDGDGELNAFGLYAGDNGINGTLYGDVVTTSVDSDGGDLTIGENADTVNIDTAGGTVTIGENADTVNIDTAGGTVTIGENADTVNIDTAGGTVNIGENSSIVIGQEGTTNFAVDSSGNVSASGDISTVGDISAEGNVSAEVNVLAGGNISANGLNVSCGNINYVNAYAKVNHETVGDNHFAYAYLETKTDSSQKATVRVTDYYDEQEETRLKDVNLQGSHIYIYNASGSTYTPTTDNEVTNKAYVDTQLATREATSNKVTSLSSSSTDTQYPSAKCVYDIVGDIESLLSALR